LIGLAAVLRKPLPAGELPAGLLALAVLAALTAYIFSLPPQAWLAFDPIAVLFPVLLWMSITQKLPPLSPPWSCELTTALEFPT
jgi:hypothetical protein